MAVTEPFEKLKGIDIAFISSLVSIYVISRGYPTLVN